MGGDEGRALTGGTGGAKLAACLYRKVFLAKGGRLTDAQAQIVRGLGVKATVVPMSDQSVRTQIMGGGSWRGLQKYLILAGGQAELEGVELEGIVETAPTPEVPAVRQPRSCPAGKPWRARR